MEKALPLVPTSRISGMDGATWWNEVHTKDGKTILLPSLSGNIRLGIR